MPVNDLPTTAVGLVAFIVAVSGYLLWQMSKHQTKTFMTYIETRNHSLEKTTDKFIATLEERDLRFNDALIKQGERHREAMDDLAARLEANLVKKTSL